MFLNGLPWEWLKTTVKSLINCVPESLPIECFEIWIAFFFLIKRCKYLHILIRASLQKLQQGVRTLGSFEKDFDHLDHLVIAFISQEFLKAPIHWTCGPLLEGIRREENHCLGYFNQCPEGT